MKKFARNKQNKVNFIAVKHSDNKRWLDLLRHFRLDKKCRLCRHSTLISIDNYKNDFIKYLDHASTLKQRLRFGFYFYLTKVTYSFFCSPRDIHSLTATYLFLYLTLNGVIG